MKWVLILLTFGQISGYAEGNSVSSTAIEFQSEELCDAALLKVSEKRKNIIGYCVKTKE